MEEEETAKGKHPKAEMNLLLETARKPLWLEQSWVGKPEKEMFLKEIS